MPIMCLVMLVVSGDLVYLFLHTDFIPNPASMERGLIDNFIQLLFAIASVFFAVIVTVFAYARKRLQEYGYNGIPEEKTMKK